MEPGPLCVACALHEVLRPAVAVSAGRSVCDEHARLPTPSSAQAPSAAQAQVPAELSVCVQCPRERRAWFVVDAEPLCIRHAAFAATAEDGVEDDMAAHSFAHAVYRGLGALGVSSAY